ncbi:MAG: hypothetical protein Aurels2KO_49560 [Aureliella sp.]
MLLLPGYELDGFPRTASSQESDELLSGWVAMWHPQIIASIDGIPRWQQVEDPPSELDDRLFVMPSICDATMTEEFSDKIEQSTGQLVRAQAPWRTFQADLLRRTELPDTPDCVSDDLLARFAALGYAYLQIQLMTRQLRYSSSLDIPMFGEHAATAAKAGLEGDLEQAHQMIEACFDALGQERDHYYSLDVQLLDLTLLAPTTLGKSLTRQLESDFPTSYLASADLLKKLEQRSPENLGKLRDKTEAREACICGGLENERPHELMSRDSLCRDVVRGRQAYESLGFAPPEVFGRLSYGQVPTGASIQKRYGFIGTLLSAMSGGKYPSGSQPKVTWESPDGAFLPAVAVDALDASDPASFLALGLEIGDALDHQHVPTTLFAHWPGRTCDYHHLMKIVSDHTPALGRWQIANTYFSETDQPYHQERFSASEFRYNWLTETEQPAQQIQRTKQFHLLSAQARALRSLACLDWQLKNPPPKSSTSDTAETADGERQTPQSEADQRGPVADYAFQPELVDLESRIDGLLDEEHFTAPAPQPSDLHSALAEMQSNIASDVARRLIGKTGDGKPGRVVLNPYCCPMRMTTTFDNPESFGVDADWHFSSGPFGNDHATRIDVPSCGFVAGAISPAEGAKGSVLAESGGLLRNEFVEVQIDTDRGHLRSLHSPGHRGNRLSVQIAQRQMDENNEPVYSQMDASDVRMLTSSPANGLVRAKGRLVTAGKTVGKFEIDYEVWRGSRIVELDIKLSDLVGYDDYNPWRSAFVLRLAWVNESANLRSFSTGGRASWTGGKAISPRLIHIDEADYHTHYLTGGLAFHRITGSRFLETILAAKGDNTVRHRVGIGVDLPNPTETAASFLHKPIQYDVQVPNGYSGASGWLASVDIATVDVAFEAPLVDSDGNNVGQRVLASEYKGTSCGATLRMLRDVKSARRVDYFGNMISQLTVEDDKVTIPMRANENALIDILWA